MYIVAQLVERLPRMQCAVDLSPTQGIYLSVFTLKITGYIFVPCLLYHFVWSYPGLLLNTKFMFACFSG